MVLELSWVGAGYGVGQFIQGIQEGYKKDTQQSSTTKLKMKGVIAIVFTAERFHQ